MTLFFIGVVMIGLVFLQEILEAVRADLIKHFHDKRILKNSSGEEPVGNVYEGMDYLTPYEAEPHEDDYLIDEAFAEYYGDSDSILGTVIQSSGVFFKPGEPETIQAYDGQHHITRFLESAIRGMDPDQHSLEPQMFLGYPGSGKTLLAKIVANELRLRASALSNPPDFIELFPGDLPDLAALDAVVQRVVDSPGSVLFFDEIHDLSSTVQLKLYLVLEEGRYQFRSGSAPVKLPPVTLLAATTDYGSLHGAMKRRWHKHFFKPATPEQLVGYVMRRPFPISRAVAEHIVERTKHSGAPWEPLEIYRMAVTMAKGRGSACVESADVFEVFDMQEIDELGLRYLDRLIISTLFKQPRYRKGNEFVCYGASESNVCMMANIDPDEYRNTIRPRLMTRGLLEMRAGYGQALTPKAVDLYHNTASDVRRPVAVPRHGRQPGTSG